MNEVRDPDIDRRTLLRLFARGASSAVRNVRVARPGCAPPTAAVCQSWLRFIIVLRGTMDTVFSDGEDVVETVRRAGDVLLYLPWSWNYQEYPSTHSYCSCTIREEYTRFLGMTYRRRDTVPQRPDVWFHTERALGGPARQVLNSLVELAGSDARQEVLQPLVTALLHLFHDELARDEGVSSPGGATRTYQRVCHYVLEHFQKPINRDTTARELGLHPNYLSRLFRDQSGETFVAYLQRLRLEHAASLLRRTDLPVAAVIAQSGFGNKAHFHRLFRARYGRSPAQCRQSD